MSSFRQAVQHLCHAVETGANLPFGDDIRGLEFGGASSAGRSRRVARVDHIHAVPAIPDGLIDASTLQPIIAEDFINSTLQPNTVVRYGNTFAAIADTRPPANRHTGALGIFRVSGTAVANNGGGIYIPNSGSATPDTTTRDICPSRLETLIARCRFQFNAATENQFHIVGAVRTSTHQRMDLITDGVWFSGRTSGAIGPPDTRGIAWSINSAYAGSVQSVNLGANVPDSGTAGGSLANVKFTKFQIDLGPEVDDDGNLRPAFADFFINDVFVGRIQTASRLPKDDALLAGFGTFTMTVNGAARQHDTDYLVFVSRKDPY